MIIAVYWMPQKLLRVNYGTLFSVLLTKCVPMCVIKLILDSYIKQKACALWNIVKSRYFNGKWS